jgi:hypothetical protein
MGFERPSRRRLVLQTETDHRFNLSSRGRCKAADALSRVLRFSVVIRASKAGKVECLADLVQCVAPVNATEMMRDQERVWKRGAMDMKHGIPFHAERIPCRNIAPEQPQAGVWADDLKMRVSVIKDDKFRDQGSSFALVMQRDE